MLGQNGPLMRVEKPQSTPTLEGHYSPIVIYDSLQTPSSPIIKSCLICITIQLQILKLTISKKPGSILMKKQLKISQR